MTAQLIGLEREIAAEQESLGANLHELESRARSAADWRAQVQRHPLAMVAVAFGCGMVLSAMLSAPRRRSRPAPANGEPAGSPLPAPEQGPVDATWERVKGALAAVVTSRAAGFLDEVLPGHPEPGARHSSKGTGPGEASGNGRRSTEL